MNFQRYWKTSILLLVSSIIFSACAVKDYDSNSQPISHSVFDSLLRRHVDEAGLVDYQGFIQDSVQFKEYLQLLSRHHPNDQNWTREERIAYWINAYNAFTIKLIMDYYPVTSIKDIKSGIPFVNTVWDIKFINIEGAEYDLNNIEHGILRPKYNEPRIHFAVNCASISCPKLQRFAYTGDKLDKQLDQAARDFLNDPAKNKLSAEKLELSKILNWYWGDFKDQYNSRVELVNEYVDEIEVAPDAEVDYLDYDWGLNGQK
ncbi:DUF547 domain-containing protein [Flavilitoribacter nigricans]|uniref:DUF547 domain-containing protein n=1 Tax=Flavilitoribacter nigricans (strain ATCC 23147 / DSM 23189 / NBRC 102662 / NCIMB 1420 / SS-2) TaxID=1122177 RepID=A0A2D0N8M8_FLAN2|nr:DUF547 domain-containing protein [Flavilitoribacter nigricans]PHN04746.1 hypothetical protein CRP01_19720 [Flavilitoribacter nigricans DSM 23189 = NBRC 102662]